MSRAAQIVFEINQLYREIEHKRDELNRAYENEPADQSPSEPEPNQLSSDEITRYSRQMILPEVGVKGQLQLKNAAVLIVGAGGLGCPSALYLVGAGLGRIGLVDYDLVEEHNLHRQLLHTEESVGIPKIQSAREALLKLNSKAEIDVHDVVLRSTNAMDIIRPYDLVVDASDNVATRYLLNDACVILGKPLVSGSALQLEGQLTVYNHIGGPCYRCIFPVPPPPETVTNCGDGGVLGAVTGVIGSLQALEVIKILLDHDGVLSGKLLIFDGSQSAFRTVKLRGKRVNCDVCSANPTITQLIDYEHFCGMRANDKAPSIDLLEDHERVAAAELNEALQHIADRPVLLVDVRPVNEFEMCSIPRSLNVPIRSILDDRMNPQVKQLLQDCTEPIYVICRRGNDSQLAVKSLQTLCTKSQPRDVCGGLQAWHLNVDSNFPKY